MPRRGGGRGGALHQQRARSRGVRSAAPYAAAEASPTADDPLGNQLRLAHAGLGGRPARSPPIDIAGCLGEPDVYGVQAFLDGLASSDGRGAARGVRVALDEPPEP